MYAYIFVHLSQAELRPRAVHSGIGSVYSLPSYTSNRRALIKIGHVHLCNVHSVGLCFFVSLIKEKLFFCEFLPTGRF